MRPAIFTTIQGVSEMTASTPFRGVLAALAASKERTVRADRN
jgi:hypothetical protein